MQTLPHRGRLAARLFFLSALAVGLARPAHAALERVGPNNPDPRVGSFPAWYQDKTGLALEFCDPLNQAEVDGGYCLLLPGDVTIPEVFPTNFFDEHFYYAAGATLTPSSGGKALLVLAVESAFATAVRPGDQITFARIRVRLDPAPVSGTYRFIHPYGEEVFENVAAGDRIFFTDDVGINCPPGGPFDCALQSRLGPFLVPSSFPGGPELPAITGPVPGKLYLADPARLGPVTGSDLPDFTDSTGAVHNHNVFRIEGPPGSELGGLGVDFIETFDFSLNGRVFTETIPGRVAIDRASYTRNGTGQKVDVFASGFATTQGRLPAQPRPAPTLPQLSFFDAACGVTAAGALTAPAGLTDTQMLNSRDSFWGQSRPAIIPGAVCVKDSAARDANGAIVPAFFQRSVTDEIAISDAFYDPGAGSLTVKASSSDATLPPLLTLGGFGDLVGGQIVVSPLAAPPAKIRVLSSYAGSNELQVTTGFGAGTPVGTLVAVNDSATFSEDSPARGIAILSNDVGVAGGVVNLVSLPRLGTAVLNTDGSVTYTPNPNASGVDGFTYTVTVGAAVSNVANVSITITPVNDAPLAVADGPYTVNVNVPTVLPNLLLNDTDPDGVGDVVNAVNLTQPALGGALVLGGAGGLVTFTASAVGTYTFTYQAQDAAGALSPNAVTVTVNAISVDAVAPATALFRTGQHRWVVSGTDSVPGQTITVSYDDGAQAGATIGTVLGDAGGNWILDIRGVSGLLDPTTLTPRPTRIRATSALGGSGTLNITIRN